MSQPAMSRENHAPLRFVVPGSKPDLHLCVCLPTFYQLPIAIKIVLTTLQASYTYQFSDMAPNQEQLDEFLLSCRFGDLEDVKAFTDEFGWESVQTARDDRGNSALHMCCGNGHLGEFLLSK